MKPLWIITAILAVFVGVAFLSLSQIPSVALAVLGQDSVGFLGIKEGDVENLEKNFSKEDLDELRDKYGPALRTALDCSSVPPEERIPGKSCIEGLLYSDDEDWTPIPEDRHWLIPIWLAASDRYGVPWELLAATAGARSAFGRTNCSDYWGDGPYRYSAGAWDRWGWEAGSTKLSPEGVFCWDSEEPARWVTDSNSKERGEGSPYDWADAIFTQARALGESGAEGKGWNYNGSQGQCLADVSDGPLFYPPAKPVPEPTGLSVGAAIGYNKFLRIPRWAARMAAQYRSDKGRYRPRRDTPDPNRSPMPKDDIIRLLVVAWTAFGYTGDELDERVTKNYAQVGRESGGRPYILQGYIGDVNDTNPAGGLFQFIPSTFDHWKVDGFNDRFNPLDNILAAVNAQVNGPYPILDGSLGWSPPFSDNPYARGGRAKLVRGGLLPGEIDVQSYRGKVPSDGVSRAVQAVSEGGTPCYIALVNRWWEAIRKNPPDISKYLPGPDGTRRVVGGGQLVPCPRKIPQDTYNACYVDRRIIPDLLWIHKRFGIYITDGYSGPLPGGGAAGCYASGYQCHSVAGEHPLGLGIDIVPVPGQSWDRIDQLAAWAEPEPNAPRPPFRWVGYDGDAYHGSGHHLHLSWDHSDPTVPYQVADWVLTMNFGFPGGESDSDLRGKVSYFGGGSDFQPVASGGFSDRPGVALNLRPGTTSSGWNNRRTQKWISWAREGRPMMVRVRTQGRSAILPVIDLGPHESTGRAIDITEAGLRKMGWKTPRDFRTDAPGTVEFLGRRK